MNQHGPVSNSDHLHEAVAGLYAVRRFLEAPYQVAEKDWQEAYDGFGHVVLAVERLAATLVARCPAGQLPGELADVHELLNDANTLLTRPGPATRPLPG